MSERSTLPLDNPVIGWDLTINVKEHQSESYIIEHLVPLCKQILGQIEKAPTTGRLHGQIRLKLIDKTRDPRLIANGAFVGDHWSPTSNKTFNTNNMDYVIKDDTRVQTLNLKKLSRLSRLVRDSPLPWQADMLKHMQNQHDRVIHCIVDETGGKGKSAFKKFLVEQYQALHLSIYGSGNEMQNDLGSQAKKLPKHILESSSPIFITIDLPRQFQHKHGEGIWMMIEEVKNGILVDKRYNNETIIPEENPSILVTTNSMPPYKSLSNDRWNIWHINQNNELYKGTLSSFQEEQEEEPPKKKRKAGAK